MVNSTLKAHSFRRIIERGTAVSQQYVFSDDRHAGLIEFLAQWIALPEARVLDLGCGAGVVTNGLARVCREAVGIDGNADNVALSAHYASESGLDNVEFIHARANTLPLKSCSLDLVLLNGVLEWVGLNDQGLDPRDLQLDVLREINRVLRPGGLLYVGIENRLHPRALMRDPHTHLPLVNALPRRMADYFARWHSGSPFQSYIYSHRGTEVLLRHAGFQCVDKYVPFPSYQYPISFIRIGDRHEALADINAIDTARVVRIMRANARSDDIRASVRRARRRAAAGVLGLLAHDHAFVVTNS